MVQSKVRGISQEEYLATQAIKAEEDFKNQTNQSLGDLHRFVIKIDKSVYDLLALVGSNNVALDQQLTEVMTSTMSSLKEFRQELGDFGTQLFNLKISQAQVKVSLEDYISRDCFDREVGSLVAEIKELKNYQESMKRDFMACIERLHDQFDDKLKSMKAAILAIPSEIPALKSLIEQKLELVDLNGQNAVLRSSNNEKQIQLVERKIENIYQLIKKVDFDNQGAK